MLNDDQPLSNVTMWQTLSKYENIYYRFKYDMEIQGVWFMNTVHRGDNIWGRVPCLININSMNVDIAKKIKLLRAINLSPMLRFWCNLYCQNTLDAIEDDGKPQKMVLKWTW